MDDDKIAVFTVTSLKPGLSRKMKGTLETSKYFASKLETSKHFASKLSTSWCIEIKHNSVPNSPLGITFGSSKDCGVMLPTDDVISKCHFSLTFDDDDRLVIKDHSTHGIEVKYGEQGVGRRDQTQCILNNGGLPRELSHIEIGIADVITFRVDVRLMMSSEPSYRQVATRWKHVCVMKSEDYTEGLRRSTLHQTRRMYELGDPSDIWLRWQVPKGTSASITRCWNTENGLESVVKTALGDYEKERWSRQVEFLTILKDHHHVVDILGYSNTSDASPTQIEMEFLSSGSLDEARDPSQVSEDSSEISDAHSEYSENCSEVSDEPIKSKFTQELATSILAQCLSVLVAMHEQPEPICHRNLKPSNILVNEWNLSGICVKIAGFGEASRQGKKDAGGGDAVYAPREFWSDDRERGPPEDIWSLGLTTLGLFKKEIQQLHGHDEREFWTAMGQSTDSLVQFLRDHMIRKEPEERSSAAECLKRLWELQAGDGIKCGCPERNPCFKNFSEREDEGVKTPTKSNAQEASSNSSTPTQNKLADGQSQETNSPPAEGSAEDTADTPTPTQTPASPTPIQTLASPTPTQTPASPAQQISAGEETFDSIEETRALGKGKRRAEPCEELSDIKRPKI